MIPCYSARLQVVCIVDDPDRHAEDEPTCDCPFVRFRADSHEQAFERALARGREQETVCKNESGGDVRWALNAVEEIYELGEDIDGIEVGSLMGVHELEHRMGIETDFEPASKQPIYSSSAKNTTQAERMENEPLCVQRRAVIRARISH